MSKRILSLILATAVLLSVSIPALTSSAKTPEPSYTVAKLSNPDMGSREIDGLIEGGDRGNSCACSMAARGDMIYIATSRSIASALVDMYAPNFGTGGMTLDTFWELIDALTSGDIARADVDEGASIIGYDRVTGEFKVIYTAEIGDWFSSAVTFGDNVYFGSYSVDPDNIQYILRLDPDGKCAKVFATIGSVSLRANCVYDDSLFFAGVDDGETVAPEDGSPVKLAVLRMSSEDDTVWDRVADYRDFGEVAYDSILTSWEGSPIWELAAHNGYIYATAPSSNGFVMFRGHPAAEGETANGYGWYWEEVVGLNNGVNYPGLSDYQDGEPGTVRSLVGSVYEFNGELYAYNFDHAFSAEASAFTGLMRQIGGANVKASVYLKPLYDSLQNPQKIWKLNDETGRFEELYAFTDLTYGTANEYIWRLGEYNGDLYAATMDAGVVYGYLTRLTNGSFVLASPSEMLDRIDSLSRLIDMLDSAQNTSGLDLEPIKSSLVNAAKLIREAFTMKVGEDELKKVYREYSELVSELERGVLLVMMIIRDSPGAPDSLTDIIMSDVVTDEFLSGALDVADVVFDNIDVDSIIPQEYTNAVTDKIVALLKKARTVTNTYSNMNDSGKEFYRKTIKALVQDYLNTFLHETYDSAVDAINKLDIEGIRMYIYINDKVVENDWGFDLFRTRDGGRSFETITVDGFGDKYNCGCSSFLATEDGLYIGTCNPFYGAQLYLLTALPDVYILGDADDSGTVNVFDASYIQKGLTGTAGYPAYGELPPDAIERVLADVDGNGSVNVFDAALVLRYTAGDDSAQSYGIGEQI